MLKKYSIEYSLRLRKHSPPDHHVHSTDDFIACEEFVRELLDAGMGIHAIRHDGVDVPRAEFDRILKIAAAGLAASRLCASLAIKPDEERYRFGFAA